MLIGIPALLGSELLATLVDGNYQAEDQANRLIRADRHHLVPMLDGVVSVLPVDDAVPEALFRASGQR
jgi:L-fucose mutarotase